MQAAGCAPSAPAWAACALHLLVQHDWFQTDAERRLGLKAHLAALPPVLWHEIRPLADWFSALQGRPGNNLIAALIGAPQALELCGWHLCGMSLQGWIGWTHAAAPAGSLAIDDVDAVHRIDPLIPAFALRRTVDGVDGPLIELDVLQWCVYRALPYLLRWWSQRVAQDPSRAPGPCWRAAAALQPVLGLPGMRRQHQANDGFFECVHIALQLSPVAEPECVARLTCPHELSSPWYTNATPLMLGLSTLERRARRRDSAVDRLHPRLLRRLLDAGIDLRPRHRVGTSLLHDYAERDDCEAVLLLLQAGHDALRRDKDRFTPLELAMRAGADASAQLLRSWTCRAAADAAVLQR